jgi:hypothetical protein
MEQSIKNGHVRMLHLTFSCECLGDTTRRLLLDLATRRLLLDQVRAAWEDSGKRLAGQLAHLTQQIDGELLVEALRWSLRRVAGMASLAVVEVLLCAVLGVFLWRVGIGFVQGEYAGYPLLLSVAAIVAALILVCRVAANVFFRSLRTRFRLTLAARDEATADAAWEAESALRDHVQEVDRLAQDGSEALGAIDRIVHSLASDATDDPKVRRLFGKAEAPAPHPRPLARGGAQVRTEPACRRPLRASRRRPPP